jgi:hypothetical protein
VVALEAAALFALALAIAVVAFIVYATYNDVVALIQRIDKAWANIDVALKQRWDELPNLVEAVKDVMTFERQVLTDVTRLRASYSPTQPIPEQARTSEATSAAIQGTGLGLSIVAAIIEAHGGSISVESEVGFGTTFRIVLPVLARAETSAA